MHKSSHFSYGMRKLVTQLTLGYALVIGSAFLGNKCLQEVGKIKGEVTAEYFCNSEVCDLSSKTEGKKTYSFDLENFTTKYAIDVNCTPEECSELESKINTGTEIEIKGYTQKLGNTLTVNPEHIEF